MRPTQIVDLHTQVSQRMECSERFKNALFRLSFVATVTIQLLLNSRQTSKYASQNVVRHESREQFPYQLTKYCHLIS